MKEMRSLRERLNSSERAAEGLKSDLSAMVAHRDQGQADLHQARLQAAQLTLQLADSSLALREGRAHWAQERQTLLRTAEVLHCCKAQNLKWGNLDNAIYLYYGRNKFLNTFCHMLYIFLLYREP